VSTKGFSLIELLVVIAIIAILAMLLTPALGVVRGQARATVCSSNLRQIGFAFQAYAEDFDGIVVPVKSAPTGKGEWGDDLVPYFDDQNTLSANPNGKSISDRIIKGCPEFRFKPTAWQNGYAMTLYPQAYYRTSDSSYQLGNAYQGGASFKWLTFSGISNRSARLLVADTIDDENLAGTGDMAFRHNKRAGVLLFDMRTTTLLLSQALRATRDPAGAAGRIDY